MNRIRNIPGLLRRHQAIERLLLRNEHERRIL